MPFFNFRRSSAASASNAASAAPHESVEVIRQRAKHRLIGAAVLVLAAVVGFPLLFDTQPRPIAIDIPIEIPAKNAVKPLVMPARPEPLARAPGVAPPRAPASVASAASTAPDKVAAAASLASREEILADKKPVAPVIQAPPAIKTEAKPAPGVDARPVSKPEPRAEVQPAAKSAGPGDDGARARALLNGQNAEPATATDGAAARMVVQVGAFADAVKAREVRLKLERAGFKTYTQVAETSAGKRIRVRIGPFASRSEAEKAASKIKTLDLPAAILTL